MMQAKRQVASGPVHDQEGLLVFGLAGESPRVSLPTIDETTRWPRLLSVALRENALVPLRDHCRSLAPTLVPPEWGQQLAILSLDTERRMYAVRRRLEATLVALNAAGLEPLLLKGAALASTVYGAWNRRAMRDIDLFLDAEQAELAREIALTTGWVMDPSLPPDDAYATHHHLPPLIDAAGSGLRLEIHRSALPAEHPFAFAPGEILRAARRVTVGAGRARVMSPEHHVVHLAIHFAWSNQMRSGAWHACRDLVTISRGETLDWIGVVRTAQQWRASSCVYWTLRLARALSGLEVPDIVMAQLRPRLPEAMLARLERHFMAPLLSGEDVCPSVLLERSLWSAAIQPRTQGHGSVRPWLLFKVRLGDPRMRAPASRTGHSAHLWRCAGYLADLV